MDPKEKEKVKARRKIHEAARSDPSSYSCYEDYYAYWRTKNSQSNPGAMMELRDAKRFFESRK